LVGFKPHMKRLQFGLQAIGMGMPMAVSDIQTVIDRLVVDKWRG